MSNEKHRPNPFGGRPILLTVEQAARCLGIGRTTMFGLIAAGEVQTVQIGRARRVPVDALRDFVRRLREAQHDGEAA